AARRLRSWSRHRASRRRAHRRRTPRRDWLHRARLGWPRSLADRRRRHALLRLPRALRLELQRILSAADDGSLAAHLARHLGRISQSHRRWRMAALLGFDLLPLERAVGDFLW